MNKSDMQPEKYDQDRSYNNSEITLGARSQSEIYKNRTSQNKKQSLNSKG